MNGLLQQGCAVLVADIPLSDEGVYEQPMKQSLEGVNAAIDAGLATGLIDEQRLGLMGTGYGGTIVNFVITQTDRFKAAASISGLSDWFADYAGGGLESEYHEFGGGRFGVPVWTDPGRYVDNSPLRYFDHVHTPLLLIHGQYDSRMPIRHAWETFHALEHLDKPVIFARYARGGHGANPEGVRRVQGWFREHLLGGKPITHLADQGSFIFGEPDPDDELVEPMPTDPAKGRMSGQTPPGTKG